MNANVTPSGVEPGPAEELIGKVLGQNYRVLEVLGIGGMGVVYLVEHVTLKKRFAAKVLASELAKHEEAIARFEAEAHAASKLDHDNIVSIIDYGHSAEGTSYIVMEHLRGENLHQRLSQGSLTLEEIIAIIVPVCQALHYAHSQGVVHRDMKLENVFLTHKGLARPVVKVLDFGVSKVLESHLRDSRLTKQGQILGSPEYMSPEAARGAEVDARADIYAVGIMLYELLCGTVPFRAENYLQVLQKHITEAPVPPRHYRPDLPGSLETVVLRALSKDREHRQQSMEELEVELIAAAPELAQRALFVPSHTPPAGIRISSPSGEMSTWSPTPASLHLAAPVSSSGVRHGSNPLLPDGKSKGLAAVALAPTQTTLTSPEMAAMPHPDAVGARAGRRGRPVALMVGVPLVLAVVAFFGIRALKGSTTDEAPAKPVAAGAVVPPADPSLDTSPTRTVIAPAQPPDARAAPDAAPAEVRFVVVTEPAGAEVTLDGKALGTTPLDVPVSATDATRVLVVARAGYRELIQELIVRADRELTFELDRLSVRSSTPGSRTKHKTKSPGTTKPPTDGLELKSGR